MSQHSLPALRRELDLIRPNIILPESEESWDKITKAINSLTVLCNSDAHLFPEEFAGFSHTIYTHVNSAINSERTRLSGAALDFVAALSGGLQHKFEPLLPLLFPTVLSTCGRSNKVFAKRAHTCLISIIDNTQLPAILPYLSDVLKDKSISLRLSATEGTLACLNCFNPPDLAKDSKAQLIESIIRKTATDASVDVRRTSRKIFEAYKILLPDRLNSFITPLTPTTKKYLDIKSVPSTSATSSRSNPRAQTTRAISSIQYNYSTSVTQSNLTNLRLDSGTEAPSRPQIKRNMPPPDNVFVRTEATSRPAPQASQRSQGISAPSRPVSVTDVRGPTGPHNDRELHAVRPRSVIDAQKPAPMRPHVTSAFSNAPEAASALQSSQPWAHSGPQRILVTSSTEEFSEKKKKKEEDAPQFKPLRPSPEAIAALKAAAEEDRAKLNGGKNPEKSHSSETKTTKGKEKEVGESRERTVSREVKSASCANPPSSAITKPSAAKVTSSFAPTRTKPQPTVVAATAATTTMAKTVKPASSIGSRNEGVKKPRTALPSASAATTATTASRARVQPTIAKSGFVPRKAYATIETKPAWGRPPPKKPPGLTTKGVGIKKKPIVSSGGSGNPKSSPTSIPLPPSPVPQEAIIIPLPPSPCPAEAILAPLPKSPHHSDDEAMPTEEVIPGVLRSPTVIDATADAKDIDVEDKDIAPSHLSLTAETEVIQNVLSTQGSSSSTLILDELGKDPAEAGKGSTHMSPATDFGATPSPPIPLPLSPFSPDRTLPGSPASTSTPRPNSHLSATFSQHSTFVYNSPLNTPQRGAQSTPSHSLSAPVDDVLQTPISNLMSTIQRGFLYTPATLLSPPQSYLAPVADIHAVLSSKDKRGLGHGALAPGLKSVLEQTQNRLPPEADNRNGDLG